MHGTVSKDLQLSFFVHEKHYNDVATSDINLKPVRFQLAFYVWILFCDV